MGYEIFPDFSLATVGIDDNGPYDSYSPWGGQTVGLRLTWDQTNHLLNMTDAAGNVTTFYDVDRNANAADGNVNIPIPCLTPRNLWMKAA